MFWDKYLEIFWRISRYLAFLGEFRGISRKYLNFAGPRPREISEALMRKLTPARVSYRDDFLILYQVYIMTESFHISLFEGTLHVDKIQVWFKIAHITRALPIPVYRQTDFTPKRVVVLRLHDTVARFLTGVKFSPRYNNPVELTPGWLTLAWHFVVVSCKQI